MPEISTGVKFIQESYVNMIVYTCRYRVACIYGNRHSYMVIK